MAEVQQPKKGCTTKFTDTLGKMDALAFSLLSINLQNILALFGITKLSDLKKLNLKSFSLDRLIALFMSLRGLDLKTLLPKLNLSTLNLKGLLGALGIPSNVLEVLDIIKQDFQRGNGIYTGGTSVPGISGTFVSNSGWQSGDDPLELDITNPPVTGVVYPNDPDPYSPNYLPLGSEHVLNVLGGLDSPEEIIEAVIPQGGDGQFTFDERIDSPVRWEVSKFVPWSEIGGNDFLRSWLIDQLGSCPPIGEYCITKRERIDQISYELYGSTQYWWILLQYNGILDLNDLQNGKRLEYPSLDKLEELYFKANSQA